MVNMARWPRPWGACRLEKPDRTSGFLTGCFQRHGVRPRNRSALAWTENDSSRSGSPLSLPSSFVHRLVSSSLSYVTSSYFILVNQIPRKGVISEIPVQGSRVFALDFCECLVSLLWLHRARVPPSPPREPRALCD